MNVLVVEPGMAPYEKEINGLSEMQATVGGLIQAIYPFQDLVGLAMAGSLGSIIVISRKKNSSK